MKLSKRELIILPFLALGIIIFGIMLLSSIKARSPQGKEVKASKAKKSPEAEKVSAQFPTERIEKQKRSEELFKGMGRNNPFSVPTQRLGGGVESSGVGLSLSGIVKSGDRKLAIINGTLVGVGEKIFDQEIMEIRESSVVVRKDSSDYILNLKGFNK